MRASISSARVLSSRAVTTGSAVGSSSACLASCSQSRQSRQMPREAREAHLIVQPGLGLLDGIELFLELALGDVEQLRGGEVGDEQAGGQDGSLQLLHGLGPRLLFLGAESHPRGSLLQARQPRAQLSRRRGFALAL